MIYSSRALTGSMVASPPPLHSAGARIVATWWTMASGAPLEAPRYPFPCRARATSGRDDRNKGR